MTHTPDEQAEFDPFSLGGYAEEDAAADAAMTAIRKLAADVRKLREPQPDPKTNINKWATFDVLAQLIWQGLQADGLMFLYSSVTDYEPLRVWGTIPVDILKLSYPKNEAFLRGISDAFVAEIKRSNPKRKPISFSRLPLPSGVWHARHAVYSSLVLRSVVNYEKVYIDILYSVLDEEKKLCGTHLGSALIPHDSAIVLPS